MHFYQRYLVIVYHLHHDIFAVSRRLLFRCHEWKHMCVYTHTHSHPFIRSAAIGQRSFEIENMIS